MSIWKCSVGQPSRPLSSWVCAYGGYEENTRFPVRRLEVPKDRVILILELGTRLQVGDAANESSPGQYDAFVVGLNGKPLITEHSGAQCCIEVALFPWTVNRLFGRAANEFSQEVVNLEDIWGSETHLLIEQLSEMSTWQERFALVDRTLLGRLTGSNRAIQPEIRWAWKTLEQKNGCISIRQLAKTIGWSDRHFAACFRRQIGITPKSAARLIRFNHAHRCLNTLDRDSLSEIAISCGYSDQSHFTREFRQFSGCSPKVYQKARFTDLLGTPADIV
ncbi:MAG: helix-turn-helix domain-containing protein [Cyanobacteria bacterium P01_G01_bin.38]